MTRINRLATLVLMLLFSMLTTTADARNEVPKRKIGYANRSNALLVTFGYTDVYNRTVVNKLKSGLSTRVVLKMVVENEDRQHVAIFARTARVTYDLWEENFVVTVTEPGLKKRTRVSSIKDVIRATGIMHKTMISRKLPPGKYRVHVLAEANPVSKKMVRDIQKWISAPRSSFQMSGSSNYFGSFVGYFIDRDIGKSDKTVQFVSQWIEL